MKIFLIIVGLLVIFGCAAGLYLTYQSLEETRDRLAETKTAWQQTEAKLNDTETNLEATQAELQATNQRLEEAIKGLEEQKDETERYASLHASSEKDRQELQDELTALSGEIAAYQCDNDELRQTIDDIQEKLDLYEDTLGTQVFSGVLPPYNQGYLADLHLEDNSAAVNPTWLELRAFLEEDKTDKNLYIPGVYMCGSYAQDLHNNAEARGIRAAFVAVHFHNADSHALNAFKTSDKGLFYIDNTGETHPVGLANLDTRVDLAKDQPYRQHLIFPDGWYLSPSNNIVKSIEIYW